jgi:hypothetical protein
MNIAGQISERFGTMIGDMKKLLMKQQENWLKTHKWRGVFIPQYEDCSMTAAHIGGPDDHFMQYYMGNVGGWTTSTTDNFIAHYYKSTSGDNLHIGDIIRYANGANAPQHFANFLYEDDNHNIMVFSRNGAEGHFGIFMASGLGGGPYGTIKGRGNDATGYYSR